MSNSSLVTYKRISPDRTSPRNHEIDTITIHCYVGQVTAKEGCDYFATSGRDVSANYVVGRDGSIGLSVEEKDRAWTTSSRANDNRAVTIEVACDTKYPYAVTDEAYKSLIKLVADICKRNKIKELKWKGDKSLIGQVTKQNMTVHRWFSATACPGEYLYSRHGQIAKEVNAILNPPAPAKPSSKVLYRVQIGAFSSNPNAQNLAQKARAKGFSDAYVVKVGNLFKVQIGAFSSKSNAENMLAKAKAKGFGGFVTTQSGTAVKSSKTLSEIAKEVYEGKWGNGQTRVKKLKDAGYDPDKVQDEVNRLYY